MLGNAPVMAMVPCVDLDRAREFYGNTLGLKEMESSEATADAEFGTAMFSCGGNTVLAVYARPNPPTADHTVAGWAVEDMDATADALISRGIKFEVYEMPEVIFDARGVAAMGDFKAAWFKDPEGNILSIVHLP